MIMNSKPLINKLGRFKDFIMGTSKPKPSKREQIKDIKPCPYCGKDDKLFTKDNGPEFPDDRIAIFCDHCGFYYSDVDLKTCKEEWDDFPRTPEARRLLHQIYK